MTDKPVLQVPEGTRTFASYIAMVVRNAMEDFHCEHLGDDQMRELNPIVRNAVCTAVHAFQNYEQCEASRQFVDFNVRVIPGYWEQPQLLDEYAQMLQ
jgi:hypothetical protein